MRIRTVVAILAAAGTIGAASPPADSGCRDLADLPAPAAPPPYGALVPCPGIRPGAFVETVDEATDFASGCSLNFVFRSVGPDALQRTYVGTAGHCVLEEAGPATSWVAGAAPIAFDGDGRRIGEYVFAIDEDTFDFALVRVDAGRVAEVDPAMCHFGGPTSMASSAPVGTIVHHFGQGLAYDRSVPGRSGIVTGSYGQSTVAAAGTAIFGDSGSGVIDADGAAIGVLVRLSPFGGWEATHLADHIGFAEATLGVDLEIVTAPFDA